MVRCRLRIGFRQSQSRQLADGERGAQSAHHSTNVPSYSIVCTSYHLSVTSVWPGLVTDNLKF